MKREAFGHYTAFSSIERTVSGSVKIRKIERGIGHISWNRQKYMSVVK